MTSKKVTPLDIKSKAGKADREPRAATRKGVQNFSDYAPTPNHVKLQDMDGQTIYIVKLEQMHSQNFGEGWKIYFKDLPNAAETLTAATFSQVLCPKLDEVYRATHDGKLIGLTSPLKAKVIVNGQTVDLQ